MIQYITSLNCNRTNLLGHDAVTLCAWEQISAQDMDKGWQHAARSQSVLDCVEMYIGINIDCKYVHLWQHCH